MFTLDLGVSHSCVLAVNAAGHGRLRRYGVATTLELCEADNQVLRIKEELELLPMEMRAHLRHYQALIQRQEALICALQAAQAGAGDVAQELSDMLQVSLSCLVARVELLKVCGSVSGHRVLAVCSRRGDTAAYKPNTRWQHTQQMLCASGCLQLPRTLLQPQAWVPTVAGCPPPPQLLLMLQDATEGRYQPTAADLVDSAEALSGAVHTVRIAQQECKRQLSKAVQAFQPFAVTTGTEQVPNENDDGGVVVDSEDEEAYVPPATADDTA